MRFFDLHCDTAVSLYQERLPLLNNTQCAISLAKAAVFDKYIQCAAVYTDTHLTNAQGWEQFFRVRRAFLDECEKNGCVLCNDKNTLNRFIENPAERTAFLLTVEDARILDNKPERLELLYEYGVRLITPVWGGNSCIGGAHNTENGLTDFGKNTVEEALTRGMIVDISHASLATANDIFSLAGRYPGQICASHSNAYTITPHSRNLRDDQMRSLAKSGGIVGINLYVQFLHKDGKASRDDVLRHIDYCVRLCGEDHVAFGCDFDGARTPDDLPGLSSIPNLIPGLQHMGYSDDQIEKLLFRNAFRFLTDALR